MRGMYLSRGRIFQNARTQRICNHHIAGTNSLQQPGHAEMGVAAQLDRIAPDIIHGDAE